MLMKFQVFWKFTTSPFVTTFLRRQELLNPEEKINTLSRNVGNYLPVDREQYTRVEIWFIQWNVTTNSVHTVECHHKFGAYSGMSPHIRFIQRNATTNSVQTAECHHKFGSYSGMSPNIRFIQQNVTKYSVHTAECHHKFGSYSGMSSHVPFISRAKELT
jgi:hypothetical protein